MAKAKQYVLEGGDLETGRRVLTYGKCEKSPYVESGLWFIHIPRIMAQSTTFLVSEEHARPSVMDEYEKDLEKWGRVAHQIIPGSDWNPQEECLWKDMPFYVHILPDGTPVRYGLSRYQSRGFPKREIWYVVIGLGDQKYTDWNNSPYSAFVVDKICVEPEFMNRMGSNPERWRLICWEAPVGIEPWQVGIDDAMVPDPFFGHGSFGPKEPLQLNEQDSRKRA